MNKRLLMIGLPIISLLGIVKTAKAASSRNSVTWEVPPGVTKVRVRSWNSDGSKDLDRVLSVEPEQTFRIDVVS